MGTYSDRLQKEVRLEYLKPEDVAAEISRHPFIFVPFGSIEWHGYHNAVGLDTLKAHEQLVGLAAKAGGLVYPPVYLGAGGGHTDWPASFMVEKEPMIRIVASLLRGFEKNGFRKAILLSGHYPNKYEYQDAAVKAYRDAGGRMEVLSIIENQVPGVNGDHAALQETSFMLHLHPKHVDMLRLETEPRNDIGRDGEEHNWMGPECKGHPCYGLVGVDPRTHASAEIGRQNTDHMIIFLEAWLKNS